MGGGRAGMTRAVKTEKGREDGDNRQIRTPLRFIIS